MPAGSGLSGIPPGVEPLISTSSDSPARTPRALTPMSVAPLAWKYRSTRGSSPPPARIEGKVGPSLNQLSVSRGQASRQNHLTSADRIGIAYGASSGNIGGQFVLFFALISKSVER